MRKHCVNILVAKIALLSLWNVIFMGITTLFVNISKIYKYLTNALISKQYV